MVPFSNPGYMITIRLEYSNKVGMLGKIASTIGELGGDIGAVDIVGFGKDSILRDITVKVQDETHGIRLVEGLKKVPGLFVVNVADRTFITHLGGKIEISSKIPLKSRDILSMVYTPGVARVATAIHNDKSLMYLFTIKKNTVLIVTDGTAVLGLGDIGPEAALPIMEGKSMIFKEFGGVDAFPICLNTKDVDEIVKTVKFISPVFGGINLEDISAPRCFEIEEKIKKEVDIPVFHDDQHGTAVVVLASLINALKIVNKDISEIKAVISGVGAAGVACTKLLLTAGLKNIIGCDRKGAIYKGRKENMNSVKDWFAENTNSERVSGSLNEVIEGANFFLGVSAPGLLSKKDTKKMAKDPIIFALANPIPEILPEEAYPEAFIIATGRSDYPNQINNALCFPGIFRGVLDCHATEINDEMKLASARAIASLVGKNLRQDYIIPSIFDKRVAKAVSHAVVKAAYKTKVAKRHKKHISHYFYPSGKNFF